MACVRLREVADLHLVEAGELLAARRRRGPSLSSFGGLGAVAAGGERADEQRRARRACGERSRRQARMSGWQAREGFLSEARSAHGAGQGVAGSVGRSSSYGGAGVRARRQCAYVSAHIARPRPARCRGRRCRRGRPPSRTSRRSRRCVMVRSPTRRRRPPCSCRPVRRRRRRTSPAMPAVRVVPSAGSISRNEPVRRESA